MNRRLFAWWFLAETVVARFTHPRTDARTADAGVRALMGDSTLFSVARTAAAVTERAWGHARVADAVARMRGVWPARSLADRIRLTAWCAAVAAVTALLLQTADSSAGSVFRSIVPVGVALGGVMAALAAAPIARAWEEKRRR